LRMPASELASEGGFELDADLNLPLGIDSPIYDAGQ